MAQEQDIEQDLQKKEEELLRAMEVANGIVQNWKENQLETFTPGTRVKVQADFAQALSNLKGALVLNDKINIASDAVDNLLKFEEIRGLDIKKWAEKKEQNIEKAKRDLLNIKEKFERNFEMLKTLLESKEEKSNSEKKEEEVSPISLIEDINTQIGKIKEIINSFDQLSKFKTWKCIKNWGIEQDGAFATLKKGIFELDQESNQKLKKEETEEKAKESQKKQDNTQNNTEQQRESLLNLIKKEKQKWKIFESNIQINIDKLLNEHVNGMQAFLVKQDENRLKIQKVKEISTELLNLLTQRQEKTMQQKEEASKSLEELLNQENLEGKPKKNIQDEERREEEKEGERLGEVEKMIENQVLNLRKLNLNSKETRIKMRNLFGEKEEEKEPKETAKAIADSDAVAIGKVSLQHSILNDINVLDFILGGRDFLEDENKFFKRMVRIKGVEKVEIDYFGKDFLKDSKKGIFFDLKDSDISPLFLDAFLSWLYRKNPKNKSQLFTASNRWNAVRLDLSNTAIGVQGLWRLTTFLKTFPTYPIRSIILKGVKLHVPLKVKNGNPVYPSKEEKEKAIIAFAKAAARHYWLQTLDFENIGQEDAEFKLSETCQKGLYRIQNNCRSRSEKEGADSFTIQFAEIQNLDLNFDTFQKGEDLQKQFENKRFKTLSFFACTMHNCRETVARAIAHNSDTLTTFTNHDSLKGNFLPVLKSSLLDCRKLKKVKISNSGLSDRGAKDAVDAIWSSRGSITELDLSGNVIEKRGVAYLARWLHGFYVLESLDLSGNTVEDAKSLAELLMACRKHPTLETIDLSEISGISPETFSAIKEMLACSSNEIQKKDKNISLTLASSNSKRRQNKEKEDNITVLFPRESFDETQLDVFVENHAMREIEEARREMYQVKKETASSKDESDKSKDFEEEKEEKGKSEEAAPLLSQVDDNLGEVPTDNNVLNLTRHFRDGASANEEFMAFLKRWLHIPWNDKENLPTNPFAVLTFKYQKLKKGEVARKILLPRSMFFDKVDETYKRLDELREPEPKSLAERFGCTHQLRRRNSNFYASVPSGSRSKTPGANRGFSLSSELK
jgi:hypothetical protein